MRRRGTIWALASGLVLGTASLSVAASSTITEPARAGDRAERMSPAFETATSPEDRAVQEMVDLVNIERGERGLPFLQLDDRAVAAAMVHAADMAAMQQLRHVGSDGSDGGVRLTRAGYQWTAWGENIGAGFFDPGTLLAAWMDSSGHRANVLGDFTDIGVGVASTADGVPYWSMLVARQT